MIKTKISKNKLVAAALAVCLITLIFSLNICADDIPAGSTAKLAVLGDAVSYGTGLQDRAGKCYGAVAASSLGLGEGGYINLSADSFTSAALSDALTKGEISVADADLAVVSVGGEDVFSVIREAFGKVGADGVSYSELTAMAKNSEFIRNLNAAIDYQALLNSAAKYAVNIENIISAIRRQNPEIRIVFLNIYDPLDGAAELASVSNLYATTLALMNRELEGEVLGSEGCYLIDLSEAFASKALELTNITSLTMTPNEKGHKLIAELLCEQIETLPAYSEDGDEDTEPPVTEDTSAPDEPQTEETQRDPLDVTFREKRSGKVFYIVGAVFIGTLGVIVGAVAEAKREKNKK